MRTEAVLAALMLASCAPAVGELEPIALPSCGDAPSGTSVWVQHTVEVTGVAVERSEGLRVRWTSGVPSLLSFHPDSVVDLVDGEDTELGGLPAKLSPTDVIPAGLYRASFVDKRATAGQASVWIRYAPGAHCEAGDLPDEVPIWVSTAVGSHTLTVHLDNS